MRLFKIFLKVVVIILTILLGAAFALSNLDKVSISFLDYKTPEIFLAVCLFVSLALGVMLGIIFSSLIHLKQRAKLVAMQLQLRSKEKELEKYKELSLKDRA